MLSEPIKICIFKMNLALTTKCEWNILILVETVQIRITGDDHLEFTQGRPFGFEVECVTADGEPTNG